MKIKGVLTSVYEYHPETHEYLGSRFIPEVELDEYLSKNFTSVEPPDVYAKNRRAVFDKKSNDWKVEEDYREYRFVREEDGNIRKVKNNFNGYYFLTKGSKRPGRPRFNSMLGPLPKNAKLIDEAISRDTLIAELSDANFHRYILAIIKLLNVGNSCSKKFLSQAVYLARNGVAIQLSTYDLCKCLFIINRELESISRTASTDKEADKKLIEANKLYCEYKEYEQKLKDDETEYRWLYQQYQQYCKTKKE